MRAIDTLGMCLKHMFKRKLRTFLTILGVMVGTAAIVLMLSLGLAQEAQFAQMMDDMNQDMTMITVHPVWGGGGGRMMWSDSDMPDMPLDDDVFAMLSRIPGVRVASPIMRGQVFLRSGRYTMQAWNVTGLSPEALNLMGYNLQQGRLLEPGDGYAAVFGAFGEGNFTGPPRMGADGWMVWGSNRAWEMSMGEEVETYVDIFNDRIDMSYDTRLVWSGGVESDDEVEIDDDDAFRPIRTMTLNVVGLLERTGDWNIDEGIIMDIDVLHSLNERADASRREQAEEGGHISALRGGRGERITYDRGMVRVYDINDTSRVAEQIQELGFHAHYAGQMITRMREQQQGLQAMLAAIAAVSLFVAALGIANTMIMAVYERTREIGVMKVIGASINDVRRLFLLEAALIGFFGGLFGIGLSLIGSYLLNNADLNLMGMGGDMSWMWGMETTPTTSLVTPWLCGAALTFASVIGLLSGYFPARRATKLSALAAIRTE